MVALARSRSVRRRVALVCRFMISCCCSSSWADKASMSTFGAAAAVVAAGA